MCSRNVFPMCSHPLTCKNGMCSLCVPSCVPVCVPMIRAPIAIVSIAGQRLLTRCGTRAHTHTHAAPPGREHSRAYASGSGTPVLSRKE